MFIRGNFFLSGESLETFIERISSQSIDEEFFSIKVIDVKPSPLSKDILDVTFDFIYNLSFESDIYFYWTDFVTSVMRLTDVKIWFDYVALD